MRFNLVGVVVAVLVLCSHAGSVGASVLGDAERTIAQGNPGAAIKTLSSYSPTTPDETARRLWALGIAYNRIGRYRAAIAPLNRLVALYPRHTQYRLELAFALIKAEQGARARYHLEQAKGAGLDPMIQARVQAEIDKLATPKLWQGHFSFALIPESNAAKRTAAQTISLGGLTFDLLPAARAKAANGVELGFGVAVLPRLGDDLRARFSADVNARIIDGNAPDDVTVSLGASVLKFGDFNTQITAGVFATQRWLDQVEYTRSHGARLTYGRAFGQRAYVSGNAEYETLTYLQGGYDVHRQAISAQLRYAATAQLMVRGGARLEHRASDFTQGAGVLVGATVGGDYTFQGGVRLGVDVSFDQNRFDGQHPLFGVARVDRKWAANVRMTNQNWSYAGFAPLLKLSLEAQKSSVALNAYRNVGASIGFTRSF